LGDAFVAIPDGWDEQVEEVDENDEVDNEEEEESGGCEE
jgi:hypothetical protein